MTYLPPPTRIRLAGATAWLVGDVEIARGNNMNGFQTPRTPALPQRVTLQAPAVSTPRSVDFLVPGTLSAKTLLQLALPAPFLSRLDAHFGTAPVGVSGASCANLRVAGSLTGSLVQPFSTTAADTHLGPGDVSTSAAGTIVGSPVVGGDGNLSGLMTAFVPTSTFDVNGMDVAWPSDAGATTQGFTLGLAALGGSGASASNPLAASINNGGPVPWLIDSNGAAAMQHFPAGTPVPGSSVPVFFSGPVHLVQGVTYLAVVMGDNNGSGLNEKFEAGATPYNPVGNLTNASVGSGLQRGISASWAGNSSANDQFRLFAQLAGVALTGLVTVSITLTGTPATPGADLYVSLEL